jgi:hypothetical protein
MEYLAQLGVAVAELFEAEGRSLRRNLVRLAIAIGFGCALLLLAVAGLGFILFGIFLLLAESMSHGDAAMLTGLAAFIFSSVGAFVIQQMFK